MKRTSAEGDIEMTSEEEDQVLSTQTNAKNAKKNRNKAVLLNTASDYLHSELSRFGIIFANTGAALNRPKSLATLKFVNAVWKEYNDRKALLNGAPPNLDFSNVGKAPFSVNELREEIQDLWIP